MDPNTPIIPVQTDGTQTPVAQTTQNQPVPATTVIPQSETTTLEEELAKELGQAAPAPAGDTLEDKTKKLKEAEKALETKIAGLEADVKAKLASLKELKASIEEEIRKIKELKDTEGKIGAELHKIEELEMKRAEIENEIRTIEQTTQGL